MSSSKKKLACKGILRQVLVAPSTFVKYLQFYNTTKLHISFSLLDRKNIYCKQFNKAGFYPKKGKLQAIQRIDGQPFLLKTLDPYVEGTGLMSNDDSDAFGLPVV